MSENEPQYKPIAIVEPVAQKPAGKAAPLKPISGEKYADYLFQIGAALATDRTGSNQPTVLAGYAVRITDKLLERAGYKLGAPEPLDVAEGL